MIISDEWLSYKKDNMDSAQFVKKFCWMIICGWRVITYLLLLPIFMMF